jgi:DHA1 family bicyclomycin/chloramphenicol resistance-like MFS transporter
MTALGPLTVDLYLPAFPRMTRELGVTAAGVQLTLTAMTVGFAVGQLLVGPLSDRVGRRPPLIAATAIHAVSSLAIAFTPNLNILLLCRFMQGAGAAAGTVVALAVVRDLTAGYGLIRMLSQLSLVKGIAPVVAPLLGVQLLLLMSWRGVFVVLGVLGLLIVGAVALFVPETLKPPDGEAPSGRLRTGLLSLLGDRDFIAISLISGLTNGSLFAYISSSPFIFQNVLGLSTQQFGALFTVNSIGVLVGVQASARIAKRVPQTRILGYALLAQLASTVGIVAMAPTGTGFLGFALPLLAYVTSFGFAFPCTQALALDNHGAYAATAAALFGATTWTLGGLIAPLPGLWGVHKTMPMGLVMAATSLIAVLAFWSNSRLRLQRQRRGQGTACPRPQLR